MSHQPKLTPRTKGAQVAPEVSAWSNATTEDACPMAQNASIAPMSEEHVGSFSDKVDRDVRLSGKAAFKDSLRLYGMLLVPVIIVSIFMFSLFAGISWVVPHILCKDYAMELSGTSLGIASCVYVTDGEYSPYDGNKTFWLLFWAGQAAWTVFFPGFVCKAIFGSAVSRLQFLLTIFLSACSSTAVFITALVYGKALNNYYGLLFAAGLSLIINVIMAPSAARFTGDRLMKWRWLLLFMFAGQVNTIYLFVMPSLITLRSQDAMGGMGLTVIRLVIHPAVWSTVLFFFRVVQRHIGRVKDLKQTCFLVWPVLYASLYGRFLLLQLENVGSVVILNFMLACFAISTALTERGSDSYWLKLLYGERAKDAMQATLAVDEMALVDQLTISMMEAASIVAASALLTFGGIASSPGVPPDNSLIWFNAFAQMATLLVFNYAEIVACGKFHNIEWRKVYPKSTRRFLSYVMLVLFVGGARLCIELLLLFCPKYYDGYGILLEQCDRPSLFQAIQFTFAKRAGNTSLGKWMELEPVNGSTGANI